MPGYERNAIPDEHRDHADDELVDRVFVKKRGDELAASHQPDVLAGELSKTAHERADWTLHELHAGRGVGWRRVAGEHDVPALPGGRPPQAQARPARLPAKYMR